VVYRWLRRWWVSGSPQCVVVYRWLGRWWVSGSPQCVVVYRWLVEKVVGQWQSTVCCGIQVVEKVVGHWQPADSLQSLAHVACEFMTELSLRSVVCESPHAATDSDDDGERSTCEIVDKVHVPGASYLHVSFDSRLMLLINVSACRSLSSFETFGITYSLKHDTSFDMCKGALFMQRK